MWAPVSPRPSSANRAGSVGDEETASFGIAEEGKPAAMKQVKRAYPKDHELDTGEGRTVRMADLPDDSDQR